MKICCLIDSLGSGGAQRQMSWLLKAMADRGHDVRLVIYNDQFNHFLPDVQAIGIEPECVHSATKLGRVFGTRRMIRRQRPDCLVAFLNTPNLLAIFSAIRPGRIPVIVSERSLQYGPPSRMTALRYHCYRFADKVVCNSYSQSKYIAEQYPFLAARTETIVNCVDLDKFSARKTLQTDGRKLLVAGSFLPVKNTHRMIQAVAIANRAIANPFVVEWFGNNLFSGGCPTVGSSYYLDSVRLVKDLGLQSCFLFQDAVNNIHERFEQYDALCLPSLYEGCPNVVCEAMASGLPVLASRVSDLPNVIADPSKLFDPLDVQSIAQTLIEFANLTWEDRQECSARNRDFAEDHFSPDKFSARYDDLFHDIVKAS